VAVGATGLLNLGLSFLSMRLGFITGIAGATVAAQTALSLSLGWLTCRYLKISPLRWSLRSWLLPFVVVGLAGWLRTVWPLDSKLHGVLLITSYAVILAGAIRLSGLNRKIISHEWKLMASF